MLNVVVPLTTNEEPFNKPGFDASRYSQLNIVEKVILSMVQFMLANKFARIFVFAYAVILHGLVTLGFSISIYYRSQCMFNNGLCYWVFLQME
jgi:hypothetical protein